MNNRDSHARNPPSTGSRFAVRRVENAASATDRVRIPVPDEGAPQKVQAGDHRLVFAPH